MTAEMRLMRETINQQYAEIAKLNRNIEALNHQIRKKDEENARLKERLSKYEKPKKNSSNSSTPPSKYGAQNEAYMSRSAEKWVRGLCFNELGVCG